MVSRINNTIYRNQTKTKEEIWKIVSEEMKIERIFFERVYSENQESSISLDADYCKELASEVDIAKEYENKILLNEILEIVDSKCKHYDTTSIQIYKEWLSCTYYGLDRGIISFLGEKHNMSRQAVSSIVKRMNKIISDRIVW